MTYAFMEQLPALNPWLGRLITFCEHAGHVVIAMQDGIDRTLKADKSVVTAADLEVTRLFKEAFADVFQNTDHILIDEESLKTLPTPEDVIGAYPYIWSLDPVDGTFPFANGWADFGISIGIMKDGKPYVGCVWMPRLDELMLADEKGAWWVRSPFSGTPVVKEVKKTVRALDATACFEMSASTRGFYRFDYSKTGLRDSIPLAFVTAAGHCATARSVAMTSQCSLWDIVGSWKALQAAGYMVYLMDGKWTEVNELETAFFDASWRFKKPILLVQKENFDALTSFLVKVTDTKQKVA